MNSGITLIDVRAEALETIKMLKNKEIDVKTASEIRNCLGLIIDVAKTQVEFVKALPNSIKEKMDSDTVKAIAGTLRDRDAELDESVTRIERSRNNYTNSGSHARK